MWCYAHSFRVVPALWCAPGVYSTPSHPPIGYRLMETPPVCAAMGVLLACDHNTHASKFHVMHPGRHNAPVSVIWPARGGVSVCSVWLSFVPLPTIHLGAGPSPCLVSNCCIFSFARTTPRLPTAPSSPCSTSDPSCVFCRPVLLSLPPHVEAKRPRPRPRRPRRPRSPQTSKD